MSKGLEALEALDYVRMCCSDGLQLPQNQSVEQVQLISNSISIIEKCLKALEIIRIKEINVAYEILLGPSYSVYEYYWEKEAYDNGWDECTKFTQEELDLLKEVFCE